MYGGVKKRKKEEGKGWGRGRGRMCPQFQLPNPPALTNVHFDRADQNWRANLSWGLPAG